MGPPGNFSIWCPKALIRQAPCRYQSRGCRAQICWKVRVHGTLQQMVWPVHLVMVHHCFNKSELGTSNGLDGAFHNFCKLTPHWRGGSFCFGTVTFLRPDGNLTIVGGLIRICMLRFHWINKFFRQAVMITKAGVSASTGFVTSSWKTRRSKQTHVQTMPGCLFSKLCRKTIQEAEPMIPSFQFWSKNCISGWLVVSTIQGRFPKWEFPFISGFPTLNLLFTHPDRSNSLITGYVSLSSGRCCRSMFTLFLLQWINWSAIW